jgi:RNase H-fold protein (predicted Holliday junction resolvase)
MRIVPLRTFIAQKHSVIAGLDYGRKNCGLSIAIAASLDDATGRPLETFPSSRLDHEIGQAIAKHGITGIVCGLPLSQGGQLTRLCYEIIERMQSLNLKNNDKEISVTMWDESNSTVQARKLSYASSRNSIAAFMTRKDELAAALILESFLNYARHHK